VEVIGCQLDLVQVVFAAHRPGRFAGSLDGWQEQSDEDSDNGDNHKEFDEGKASARGWIGHLMHLLFPCWNRSKSGSMAVGASNSHESAA
jgi:hypothetical protein